MLSLGESPHELLVRLLCQLNSLSYTLFKRLYEILHRIDSVFEWVTSQRQWIFELALLRKELNIVITLAIVWLSLVSVALFLDLSQLIECIFSILFQVLL